MKKIRGIVSRFNTLSLVAVTGMFAAAAANASVVIYSAGFESPTFTTGPLAGQDGWGTAGTVSVENALVLAGSQSVSVIADASGIQAVRQTSVNTTTFPDVVVQADIAIAGNPTNWFIDSLGAGSNILGGITILPDGSLQATSAGSPTVAGVIAQNTPYLLDLTYNFPTASFSVFINGSPIFSNLPFQDASNTQFFAGYVGSDGAGGLMLLDDYVVAATPAPSPEPSSLALWAVGALLLGGLWIRRRQVDAEDAR